jgi:hypothetical protein
VKLTKEQQQQEWMKQLAVAAEYFVAHVDPEKDERTSRTVAFQSGFVSALRSVGLDINAVEEPEPSKEEK